MKFTDKNSIDDFFKSRLDGIKKNPSKGIWEAISKQLNPSYSLKSISGRMVYGAASLGMLAGLAFLFLSPQATKNKKTFLSSAPNQITQEFASFLQPQNMLASSTSKPAAESFADASQRKLSNASSTQGTANVYALHAHKDLNSSLGQDPMDVDAEVSIPLMENDAEPIVVDQAFFDKTHLEKMAYRFHGLTINAPLEKHPDTLHIKRRIWAGEKLFKMKGLHVAAVYQLHSKWISKQNTYESFGKNKLSYTFGLGNAYGLAVGYDFSSIFGMQIEYIAQSEHGQDYEEIIKKKVVKKSMALNYTQFPLLFKLKSSRMSGFTNKPLVINYLAGIQYGVLKSAQLTVNNQSMDISNRFLHTDFAAIFGVETDVFLSHRLFFSSGIRFEYGLKDINAEGWKMQNAGKSQNILSGISFGLHYMVF